MQTFPVFPVGIRGWTWVFMLVQQVFFFLLKLPLVDWKSVGTLLHSIGMMLQFGHGLKMGPFGGSRGNGEQGRVAEEWKVG